MLSPAEISSNRFTSGGMAMVSVVPSSPLNVSLRAAVSTASTVAVNLVVWTAAASPGTPVDLTSSGSGPAGLDEAQPATTKTTDDAMAKMRMETPASLGGVLRSDVLMLLAEGEHAH